MHEVLSFWDSPELWKSIAFCISASLVVLPIYRILIKLVKKRAEQISSHWEQALKLRREAENLLWQVQSKHFHKEVERKKIVQAALKEARQLKQDAKKEQDIRFDEKKQEILDRVYNIRQSGLTDLKEKVINIAVDTTADILVHSKTISDHDAFIECGLKDLEWMLAQNKEKDCLLQAIQND